MSKQADWSFLRESRPGVRCTVLPDLMPTCVPRCSLWPTIVSTGRKVWQRRSFKRTLIQRGLFLLYKVNVYIRTYFLTNVYPTTSRHLERISLSCSGCVTTVVTNMGLHLLRMFLIGRRSCLRGGTRFFARGIDDDGQVWCGA